MKRILSLLLLSVLACAGSAHGQLLLTGTTRGDFTGPLPANTWVLNGPVTSIFASGIPGSGIDTQTSITFTGASFTNEPASWWFGIGSVKIKNGMTLLGTTAATATMDLYMDIPAEGVSNFLLTTLTFGLDNTSNSGTQNIPDIFYLGHSAPATLVLPDKIVSFDIALTDPTYETGQSIGERKTGTVGLTAAFTFVPVPEPSTYAAFAALGLIGVAAVRRFRRPAAQLG
ncbi:choice-of-anchor K domain-containing protein [Opitutus terrae]|uniref:Ice-binding protein C-terminal domain-containing protein n=1 Tax=Opitutus terrae (strain DSM 11246 / JCM 15787 / PB90-1) TaxID=452637 RepID=B1ZZ95_OPITP|nr:choice-of-anchor K domain-containing protein [Opitutus terrae]ACB77167.1 hypothetical protein Oter_3893 [Opitutus terrae PB90-1]